MLVRTRHEFNWNRAGAANSVSVHDGIMAVAIEAKVKQDMGYIAFYKVDGHEFIKAAVKVGRFTGYGDLYS